MIRLILTHAGPRYNHVSHVSDGSLFPDKTNQSFPDRTPATLEGCWGAASLNNFEVTWVSWGCGGGGERGG